MGWTKRQIVEKAYEKIGLASYVFDLSAEQLQGGMSEMDGMIGAWYGEGIRLGAPMPFTPTGGDLSDDSRISVMYVKAVYENLALLLAQNIGRQVSPLLVSSAKKGYNILLSRSTQPPTKRLDPTTPLGAGYRRWGDIYRNFVGTDEDTIASGDDSELEFK